MEEIDAKTSTVRNALRMPNLQRSDHGAALTCKAANTNLTQPVETTVKINMVCKYREGIKCKYVGIHTRWNGVANRGLDPFLLSVVFGISLLLSEMEQSGNVLGLGAPFTSYSPKEKLGKKVSCLLLSAFLSGMSFEGSSICNNRNWIMVVVIVGALMIGGTFIIDAPNSSTSFIRGQ